MNEPAAPNPDQMSEQELRQRLAEEMKKIAVRDVLMQTIVTLINLGGQRLGVSEETKEVRDLDQSRLAIETVRVMVPLLEESAPGELAPVRDALAQLQVAYAREAAGAESTPEQENKPPTGEPPDRSPEQPQPHAGQGEGGLWVPPGSKI